MPHGAGGSPMDNKQMPNVQHHHPTRLYANSGSEAALPSQLSGLHIAPAQRWDESTAHALGPAALHANSVSGGCVEDVVIPGASEIPGSAPTPLVECRWEKRGKRKKKIKEKEKKKEEKRERAQNERS